MEAHLSKRPRFKGRPANKQFIQKQPEAVDVSSGVDFGTATPLCLLGTHVVGGADKLTRATVESRFTQGYFANGLGDSEVNDLWQRRGGIGVPRLPGLARSISTGRLAHPARRLPGYENIRRLKIPVDDALLVGMLHRGANLEKQIDTYREARNQRQ